MSWWTRQAGDGRHYEYIHESVYSEHAGALIDVFVLPFCEALWAAGIETYYSCQGGLCQLCPNGDTLINKAYLVVHKDDGGKAWDILYEFGVHPMFDPYTKPMENGNVAIRFDISLAALLSDMKRIK